MNKKVVQKSVVILFIFLGAYVFAQTAFYQTNPVTEQKLTVFPVPDDCRNYFFLQSIDDTTSIVISDFTGERKLISLIIDNNSDGKIDNVYDFYPENKRFLSVKRSSSQFFKENINDIKKDIISGKIFRENYSYKMRSLNLFELLIKKKVNLRKDGDGYMATIFDEDAPSTPMSEFFVAKIRGRYHLAFRTSYYKLFNAKIYPPLEYSVYCRNSKDPVVGEFVESILKLIKEK